MSRSCVDLSESFGHCHYEGYCHRIIIVRSSAVSFPTGLTSMSIIQLESQSSITGGRRVVAKSSGIKMPVCIYHR